MTTEEPDFLESLKSSIESLNSEREFDLGEDTNIVHFRIGKLKAIPCYKLWETVRVAAGELLRNGAELPAGRQITSTILSMPEPVIEKLRTTMFQRVWFRRPDISQSEMVLAGMEDTAFEHLEAAHIYAVLGRCIAVNFLPTLSAALSQLGAVGQLTE